MPHLKRTLKIVAVCLAVGALLLLRRPPKPSDAAITGVEEEPRHRDGGVNRLAPQFIAGSPREWLSKPKEDFVPRAEDAPRFRGDRLAPAEAGAGSPDRVWADVQGVETPVGVVDARNCVGLNYNQIMRGAVSTRMIWNGHTFVPQKVCVVKEGDSVASVWSFEQSSGAIVSELRTDSRAPSTAAQK
jgi:hypothetical protein